MVVLMAEGKLGAKPPVAIDGRIGFTDTNKLTGGNLANFAIGSQVSVRIVGEVSGDVVVVDVELVVGEQDQRREIGRPPDSALLQVIEDVPDGHVVDGKKKFALFGLPD